MHALVIDPKDNLGVALQNLVKEQVVKLGLHEVVLMEDVASKHKFALADIAKGGPLYLYGVKVATALNDIGKGRAITTENVIHSTDEFSTSSEKNINWYPPDIEKWKYRTFMGYHRKDGQVGTANQWLVFPLVFCENRNIKVIERAFEKALGLKESNPYENLVEQLANNYQSGTTSTNEDLKPVKNRRLFENVELKFITHDGGCGGTREDSDTLCKLLAGYIHNPNVAGATVLSLGCQHAEIETLETALQHLDPSRSKPVIILDQQTIGTESDLISTAIRETFNGLVESEKILREPAPLEKLTLGLECGGSDGFSGISANPAVGYASDLLVALGGKVMLSEFPELCGVEQELINRTREDHHAEKFSHLMRTYDDRARQVGSGFEMNPSPGNIKDGLITDAIKSAGAAKKGGTSPVEDVLDYTEYATSPGLSLLCTPGNDVESTTGLAGSGANMILFTTGLGTPTGNPISPVVKISTNSQLTERMPDIIDVDAGPIISGDSSIEEIGEEILDYVIKVASGKEQTKAVGLRQYDFIPWKRGVSL